MLAMVDDYEEKYGPCNRSDFEGEFIVPQELRNRANSINIRSLKLHGGFLGLSKSRTFLTLPHRHSHNIHASVPDLSRSVPTTPGSNHKLSLASSYDSMLEEPDSNQNKKGKKSKGRNKVAKYFFSYENVGARPKSEDNDGSDENSFRKQKPDSTLHSNVVGTSANCGFNSLQMNHPRKNSEPSNRFIPVRAQLKKQPPLTSMISSLSRQPRLSEGKSVPSLYRIESSNETTPNESPNKVKTIRSSISFSTELDANEYLSYTIPRVSLSAAKGVSVDILKTTEHVTDSAV